MIVLIFKKSKKNPKKKIQKNQQKKSKKNQKKIIIKKEGGEVFPPVNGIT